MENYFRFSMHSSKRDVGNDTYNFSEEILQQKLHLDAVWLEICFYASCKKVKLLEHDFDRCRVEL